MGKISKEDIYMGLAALQEYMDDMSEPEFEGWVDSGLPLCSTFMPHDWRVPRNGSFQRILRHLEVKVK